MMMPPPLRNALKAACEFMRIHRMFEGFHFEVHPGEDFVANPGYNADRGPVSIGSVRVHAEF